MRYNFAITGMAMIINNDGKKNKRYRGKGEIETDLILI